MRTGIRTTHCTRYRTFSLVPRLDHRGQCSGVSTGHIVYAIVNTHHSIYKCKTSFKEFFSDNDRNIPVTRTNSTGVLYVLYYFVKGHIHC